MADGAETARATFELAHRFALFAPQQLLASPALHPLMHLAVVGPFASFTGSFRSFTGSLSHIIWVI